MTGSVRWGVLGTARIAQNAFLPALRQAGGRAVVVGGRDLEKTRGFAQRNEVERAVEGYESVVNDPEVQAVYNPLPNSLHGEWTIRALENGKAVLCEKPLCGDVAEAAKVLEVAKSASMPLWEAFVFPFHRQQERLMELARDGAVGEVREIHSEFHFRLTDSTNIRLNPDLGGGGLNDVGCYPIRFGQLLFGATPARATAVAKFSQSGVDVDLQGIVEYEGGQRLVLSCGMERLSGTFSRLIGDEGEIRVSNPFHAREFDVIEVRSRDEARTEQLGSSEPSFTDALRHIGAVVEGAEQPRHTAIDDSLATEIALSLLGRSARSGRVERWSPA